MQFKLIFVSLILSMMSGMAHAGFAGFSGLTGFPSFMDISKGVGSGAIQSGENNDVEKNVEAFLKIAGDVNALMVQSSDVLFKAVATEEDIEAHDREVKAATEIADPKERNAALRKVQDEEQVALANFDYAAKAKKMEKEMDKQKRQLIGASIYNFILGMLKDQLLMDIGNNWISSANSNPAMAPKFAPVKDVIASISSRMDKMTKIASGIRNLSAVVKLDNLPTSPSDTPMSTSVD